jgi:long-chain acyl-CoA synthetase
VLATLPYSHLFGLTVTASAPLMTGARVTTMDRFHPVKAAEALAGDVSVVVGVPAVFHGMLTGLARRGTSIKGGALRLAICGGAPLSLELQERWFDATGVELRQGYGLTEGAPVCLYNHSARPNVRGTLGIPFPGVDVAILPPLSSAAGQTSDAPAPVSTSPRAVGEAGEICVRGENVFAGYLHDGDAGLPVRDGWLYTGDEGVMNADGTVTFLRVLKPMFTRNGFNIYPRELERVVGEMPGVARVVVTGIPDAVKEHDIRMEIAGAVTDADVRAWCEANLSAYKQPSVVAIRPA